MTINETTFNQSVATADISARQSFIKKTYLHTALSVVLFAIITAGMVVSGVGAMVLNFIAPNPWLWFVVLGAFMVVAFVADNMAKNSTSKGVQYAGLGLFIVAEAVIFSPMILIAAMMAPGLLLTAFGLTGFLFIGLSILAFKGGVDWSFLGKFLFIGFIVALGVMILATIWGTSLGLWFSGALILLASGSILYNTSQIMNNYNTTQYVAASLSLFASVALLFWYILQFLLSLVSND